MKNDKCTFFIELIDIWMRILKLKTVFAKAKRIGNIAKLPLAMANDGDDVQLISINKKDGDVTQHLFFHALITN